MTGTSENSLRLCMTLSPLFIGSMRSRRQRSMSGVCSSTFRPARPFEADSISYPFSVRYSHISLFISLSSSITSILLISISFHQLNSSQSRPIHLLITILYTFLCVISKAEKSRCIKFYRYTGIIYIIYEYDERNCFVLSIFGLSNTWSGLPCSSIYPSSMNMT